MKTTILAISCLFVGTLATAEDVNAEPAPPTADTAFQMMKTLEGTWTGELTIVPVGTPKDEGTPRETTVTFENIANGSSVVANFAVGTPMEMMSVFHQDGPEKLIHTHYCAVGNQPSMAFEKSDEPATVVFKFTGGTNMDVDKDPHVHDSTFRFVDPNTVTAQIITWRGGQHANTQYWTLAREE